MHSPHAIRPATPADAAGCLAIYAPIIETSATSFELKAPTSAEFARRIEDAHEWLIAERDGHVLGYAYGGSFRARTAYRHSVETSVYIATDERGTGLGRDLYTDLLNRLAQRDFHIAYAGITLPNPASIALHERLGFTPVGVFHHAGRKFDTWHDVGFWQLPLGSVPSARSKAQYNSETVTE